MTGLGNLIEALLILSTYDTTKADVPLSLDPDGLVVKTADCKDVEKLDAERLNELGFHWDGRHQCWCSSTYSAPEVQQQKEPAA